MSYSKSIKEAVVLNFNNLDSFVEFTLAKHGSISPHILKVLTDPTYTGKISPKWNDMITFEGFPVGHYLWATLDSSTGALSPKLDIASIESLKKALREFDEYQLKTLATENTVLTEITSRISSISSSQIKAFAGNDYVIDSLNLSKMWKLIKSSHEKANTTTMIETMQAVTNLQQGSAEDYYSFIERADNAYRVFSSVFSLFLSQDLSVFVDLLMSLSVVGGLDKNSNVYDTAIQEIRLMDLSTPSAPIYSSIIALLTKSYHTRCLLESKAPNLMGLAASVESPLQLALSTITNTVADNCSQCGCIIPHFVDPKNQKVRHMCKTCWTTHVIAKKKSSKLLNTRPTSVPLIPFKTATPKPAAPAKSATAVNFAGTNAKLTAASSTLSASQQFLSNYGSYDEDDVDSIDYSDL